MTKIPTPGTPVRGSRTGAPIMALFDLLGRRWAMGVLWTVCEHGPMTFRQLQEKCENISPAALNQRMKELRAAGLLQRTEQGYATTDMGKHIYKHLVPLGAVAKEWAKLLDVD